MPLRDGAGPRTRRWLRFRQDYLRDKRNHEGFYVCELCGGWRQYIELDHIAKRSVAPERLCDPGNVRLV